MKGHSKSSDCGIEFQVWHNTKMFSLSMANFSTQAQVVQEKRLELGTKVARVTIVSQVLTAFLSDNSRPPDLSMSHKAFKASSSLEEKELPILKVSFTLREHLASAEMLSFQPHSWAPVAGS